MRPFPIAALGLGLTVLAACGEPDVRLEGDRFAIRPGTQVVNQARSIALPPARLNAAWTHVGGEADHAIAHPALTGLSPLFAVPIGQGDTASARITAAPVVSGGVIYTLDARNRVSATTAAGQPLWSATVPTGLDNVTDASGGGLAVSGNRLFVSSGFGAITAYDARSGGTLWTQDLDAPATSAPTVQGGLVYVVGRDNTAWAIDVADGRVQWQIAGTPSDTSFGGGSSPALSADLGVFPYDSGEIVGAFPLGGLQRWSTVVSGARIGSAAALVTDIAADPVIDGGRIYAGNFEGRTAAIDPFTGDRIWTAPEGATGGPVVPVGGSVFLVNDRNELLRLDAATGDPIWRVDLPVSVQQGVFKRTTTFFAHYGPILAGGRLIVASSDGNIRAFDPVSGALVAAVPLPGGAASAPVVANGTLYVVSKDGRLHAFR